MSRSDDYFSGLLSIGLAFVGVSLVRGYLLRRLFDIWQRD